MRTDKYVLTVVVVCCCCCVVVNGFASVVVKLFVTLVPLSLLSLIFSGCVETCIYDAH